MTNTFLYHLNIKTYFNNFHVITILDIYYGYENKKKLQCLKLNKTKQTLNLTKQCFILELLFVL